MDVYGIDNFKDSLFNFMLLYLIYCGVLVKDFKGFFEVLEYGWGLYFFVEEFGIVFISLKLSVI